MGRRLPAVAGLVAACRDISAGPDYRKPPAEYGAFPTDPYSHTPKHNGARRPGMTGTTQEAILTRQAEAGVRLENGRLVFSPFLFENTEPLTTACDFTCLDVLGEQQTLHLPAGSPTCSVCRTPVTVQCSRRGEIEIQFADETTCILSDRALDEGFTCQPFWGDGVLI